MPSCGLCLESRDRASAEAWDKPILESSNFVALPSLGALVEGWTLLVPRQHFMSMGALPDTMVEEMDGMKRVLCSAVSESYGQVCAFEHGPSATDCAIGCGVDHAHLHIVPFSFDLSLAVAPFLPDRVYWVDAGFEGCRDAYARGESYLYFEQPIGSGRIAIHQGFGSQVFRRAIAASLGVPGKFNWREYQQLSNVTATSQKLLAWFQRREGRTAISDVAA
jgi:ATP adenylyltransferase